MRQQHAPAQSKLAAVIGRVVAKIELGIDDRALPLTNIAFAFFCKGFGQRLKQFRRSALVTSTKCNRDREFTVVRQIDFAGQGDIPVRSCSELPIHFEVVHQILPTIAEADVADRAPGETAAGCH